MLLSDLQQLHHPSTILEPGDKDNAPPNAICLHFAQGGRQLIELVPEQPRTRLGGRLPPPAKLLHTQGTASHLIEQEK